MRDPEYSAHPVYDSHNLTGRARNPEGDRFEPTPARRVTKLVRKVPEPAPVDWSYKDAIAALQRRNG